MARAAATPRREDCTYAASYCEENVYKLCEQLIRDGTSTADNLFVCFISNPVKQVPLWWQKASREGPMGDGLVVWDYHVILIQTPPTTSHVVAAYTAIPAQPQAALGAADSAVTSPQSPTPSDVSSGVMVWDLDTLLPFPSPAITYAHRALRHATMMQVHQNDPTMRRYFRVVPAMAYLTHFASDRSHMRTPPNSLGGRSLHVSASTSGHTSPPNGPDHDPDEDEDMFGTMSHAGTDAHHTQHSEMNTQDHYGRSMIHSLDGGSSEDEGAPPNSQWLAPPPPWPPIHPSSALCTHSLPQYWDVGPHNCAAQGQAPTYQQLAQQWNRQAGVSSDNGGGRECVRRDGVGAACRWLGCVYDEEQFVRNVLLVARHSSEGWVRMAF